MLSIKQGGIKYHFLSLWIEPQPPESLANTLLIKPMDWYEQFYFKQFSLV